MSKEESGERHVEFRREAGSERPATGQNPPDRHVLKGIPGRSGTSPSHLEFFSEADVDGFPTDTPRWVAYCPDCGAKLALKEHEACRFFRGKEADDDGFVVAVQCGLPGRKG